jgi:hypothetical protein
MTATASVVRDPAFSFNGVDLTGQVESVKLPFSLDEVEKTASGNSSHVFMPGLAKFSFEVNLFTTYGTGSIDELLWNTKGTAATVVFSPHTGAASADNPHYSCTAFVSKMPILEGSVGKADMKTMTFTPVDDLVRTIA